MTEDVVIFNWLENVLVPGINYNYHKSFRGRHFFSFSQTTMASQEADAGSSKPIASSEEQQGERKPAAVSFGFTKTASKFKPLTSDAQAKKDDRDYLTGIHGNELQRSAFSANANITFRCHLPVTFLILASHCNYCAF